MTGLDLFSLFEFTRILLTAYGLAQFNNKWPFSRKIYLYTKYLSISVAHYIHNFIHKNLYEILTKRQQNHEQYYCINRFQRFLFM